MGASLYYFDVVTRANKHEGIDHFESLFCANKKTYYQPNTPFFSRSEAAVEAEGGRLRFRSEPKLFILVQSNEQKNLRKEGKAVKEKQA